MERPPGEAGFPEILALAALAGSAVLAQSESDPSATELLALEEMNEDCNYVYLDSYSEEIQSRKRSVDEFIRPAGLYFAVEDETNAKAARIDNIYGLKLTSP